MKNISFQANSATITAIADKIFGTVNEPKHQQQWQEFIKLLNNTNEISRLYYFKENGVYDYRFAQIGHELAEEEKLRRHGHRPYKVVILKTNPGWKVEDFEVLYQIASINNIMINEIGGLAFKIFNRILNPCFLSGPLSANEIYPSMKENRKRMAKTIWKLQCSGYNMFDQTPLMEIINAYIETNLKAYSDNLKTQDEQKRLVFITKKRMELIDEVLEEVFYPLLESGKTHRHFLMHSWGSSYGAKREEHVGNYCAIPSYELRKDFILLSVKQIQNYLLELPQRINVGGMQTV